MTTNVYDKQANLLTSDARWSREGGEWIVYVDDTCYDKILCDAKMGFLFAGDLPKIDIWKKWISNGRKTAAPIEQLYLGRLSVIQVELSSGDIKFKSHKFENTSFGAAVRALYAGTGAPHAKICWDKNKCALTAVESAKISDKASGGTVMHFNRRTKKTNVTNTATAAEVEQQLKTRGTIMHINDAAVAPMSIIDAANDPSKPAQQAIAQMVISGGITLSAPFPEMDEPWSEEKIKEFEAALKY